VKVEAYCVFEDYLDVILTEVQEQVRHQLTKPQRAKKSRTRVPARGRSQLFLRDCHYHRFYHGDSNEEGLEFSLQRSYHYARKLTAGISDG
jgi:hypothetical protein